MKIRALVSAALLAAAPALAQTDVVTPPKALVLENVPAIPADLAKKLDPYGDFRPHGMLSWNPNKREMLIRRRLTATNQVHLVTEPGATPVPLTDYPDTVPGASYQPKAGKYFIFGKAEGGNEVFRGYRQDLATKEAAPFTPEGERVSSLRFSRDDGIQVNGLVPKVDLYEVRAMLAEQVYCRPDLLLGLDWRRSPRDHWLHGAQFVTCDK